MARLALDVATRRVPPTLAELAEDAGGTLLRMRSSSLDWVAAILAGLDCDFAIRQPTELHSSVRALAARLERRAV